MVRAASKQWPETGTVLAYSYPLAAPMVILALMAPVTYGDAGASRRFLLGSMMAAILTAIGFAMFPAAGPWTTEGFDPTPSQVEITRYLSHLKQPGSMTVNAETTAIVSFPSFHVALAIITAVAIGSFRRLRIVTWVLTVLICCSTLTTGWHYGIDIAGGLGVALTSVWLARWADRKLAHG